MSLSTGSESVMLCPAHLVMHDRFLWQLSSTLYPNVSGIQSFSISSSTRISIHDRIGLSLQSVGIQGFKEWKITSAYARKLTKSLSIGLGAEMHTNSTKEYGSVTDFSFHISIQASISKTLSVSTMIYNPIQIGQKLNIPTTLLVGIKLQPTKLFTVGMEIEQTLNHPIRIKTGIQYQIHKALTLRWGAGISPGTIHAGISWYFWKKNTIHSGWKLRPGGFHQLAFSLSNQ